MGVAPRPRTRQLCGGNSILWWLSVRRANILAAVKRWVAVDQHRAVDVNSMICYNESCTDPAGRSDIFVRNLIEGRYSWKI